jgi:putative tricarboxylic transport membrane protein
MKMTGFLLTALFAAAAALVPGAATGQPYPQKPVTVMVGAAPGGSADTAIRVIADRMSAALGQQIMVENAPGAGGMTATGRVARARPDGYTLLIQQNGLSTIPALYPDAPFNVERDLTAIGLVNSSYSVLIGRKSLAANTLPELVAWMQGPAAPVRLGFPGVASFGHLSSLLFAKAAGVKPNLVPYRGVAPLINDLLGEHIDIGFGSATIAVPLIKSGAIKAYAYSSTNRHPALPNVPTYAELGYADLSKPLWHALFAPAGTPRPIIERLNKALREVIADPNVQRAYAEQDLEAFPPERMTPEAANEYVHGEVQRWGQVIRDANIQPER